jgi:hypothetical protein
MRNRIAATAATLLLVTAQQSAAQVRTFAMQWEGPDANATGFATLDFANVTNPGYASTYDGGITDFELKVTGAYSGNGTFTFLDYDGLDTGSPGGIDLGTGEDALDFTRELVGQPTGDDLWGLPEGYGGQLLIFRDFGSQAPGVGGPFWITTSTGSDLLALTSFRPTLCGDVPVGALDCRAAEGSRLVLKDTDKADSLKWLWSGDGFGQADLGDPTSDTYYSLCIYDETGSVPVLASEIGINKGEGWTDESPRGVEYAHDGSSFGVTKLRIKTAADGRTSVKLQAGTEVLQLPAPFGSEFFDQDGAVTVQLVSSEGTCWSSSYAPGDTSRNDAESFKARFQ